MSAIFGVPVNRDAPPRYDFFVSSSGGTGAGTKADPWSWAYAIGSGVGSAQGDGKLKTSGARVAVRGGSYARTDSTSTINCVGTVIDYLTEAGCIVFEGYKSSTYALPERATFEEINTGNPPTGTDNILCTGSSVILKYLELKCTLSTRVPASEPSGPTNFSTFGVTVDNVRLVYCDVHDGSGGVFMGDNCGQSQIYGNIFRYHGYAMGDGGGHSGYYHHTSSGPVLTVRCNIHGPDEGISVQLYGASGNVQYEDFLDNIVYNSGTLNSVSNLGGKYANALVIGGTGLTDHINFRRNYTYWPDNYGDTTLLIGQGGTHKIGAAVAVTDNYFHGGGSGWGFDGSIFIQSVVDVAGGGLLTHKNNTYRVQSPNTSAPDNGHNGKVYHISELGGSGYDWGNNTVYRQVGIGGFECGDETGTGIPLLAKTPSSACRNHTTFNSDCSFSGGTVFTTDPGTTLVVTIPANQYERGRGHVCYYNYQSLSRIPVDMSNFLSPGDIFQVNDVRDIWGAGITVYDAASGGNPVTTYTGATVYFPTTQLSDPAMSGANWGTGVETAPPATAPFFNAFLVRKVG